MLYPRREIKDQIILVSHKTRRLGEDSDRRFDGVRKKTNVIDPSSPVTHAEPIDYDLLLYYSSIQGNVQVTGQVGILSTGINKSETTMCRDPPIRTRPMTRQ